MPHRFHRLVATNPPTDRDFLSNLARGRVPLHADSETLRLLGGISVYATEAQARRKGRASPVLGRFIAVLELPDAAPVRVERTLLGSAGHHTLWGDPAVLLDYVVAVVPVRAAAVE